MSPGQCRLTGHREAPSQIGQGGQHRHRATAVEAIVALLPKSPFERLGHQAAGAKAAVLGDIDPPPTMMRTGR